MKEYKKAKGAGIGKKARNPKSSTHSRPSKAMPRDKAVKVSEIRLDVIASEARKVRNGFDGLRISLDFLEFHFNELKKDIENLKKSIRSAGGKNRAAAKRPCLAKAESIYEALDRFEGPPRSEEPMTDGLQKEIVKRLKTKILSDICGKAPKGTGK